MYLTTTISRTFAAFFMCTALAGAVEAAQFAVTSPSIAPGGTFDSRFVLNGFGCTGGNISPALDWSGAPKGTRSFAVTLYDPDAPTGSGWWHWVMFNIPPDTTALPEGAAAGKGLPDKAVASTTDFGKPGYGGPCPPIGDAPHRYRFTVYALKVDALPLDDTAPAAMVGFMIGQNTIGKATLEIRHGR